MGLDPEVISSRLGRLDEYLRILEELAQVEEGVFVADPRTHGSAERFLHDYFRLERTRVHLFIRTRLDGSRHFAADVAR